MHKRGNLVQKHVIKQAFGLVNEQTKSEIANQMRVQDSVIYGTIFG